MDGPERDVVVIGEALARSAVAEAARGIPTGTPSDVVEAEGQLALARRYMTAGRDTEAGRIVDRLLESNSLEGPSRALAVAISGHVHTVTGDLSAGRRLARQAVAAASESGSVAALGNLTLSRASLFSGDLEGAARAARRATVAAATATPDELLTATIHEAFMLMHVDRFEEAERCVYSVLKQPFDLGDMPPFARLALGAIRFHSGRWEHIERYLQLEPDPASSEYSDESWAVATALLTITFVHCDRIGEAEELIVRATRALATGSRPLLLWAALLAAEAAGRRDDMASLADRLIAALDFLQSPIRLRTSGPDLVRVLLQIDKRPRADAVAQALEELAAATEVASVAAAARLARGMVTMDPETLATAATLFEACGRPLEQATALEYLSLTLAASDRAAAIAVGRDAVAVYAQLGARRDERRVAAALRAIGAGTGRRGPRSRDVVGWGSLSPTERTVAKLVARGMTNHEIGTSLQISPRTVESHIAHALNKLAVRNRAELAAIVGREGSSAPD